jgi:hypothetical protein
LTRIDRSNQIEAGRRDEPAHVERDIRASVALRSAGQRQGDERREIDAHFGAAGGGFKSRGLSRARVQGSNGSRDVHAINRVTRRVSCAVMRSARGGEVRL